MKTRAAKFLAAIVASILSSANVLAAPEATEQPAADPCLTSPREYTPPGTRWRYRVERGSGRHCWFLKDEAEKPAGKAAEPSAAATEEPASPRKKTATSRSVSDARAEFSSALDQNTRTSPAQGVTNPMSGAAIGDGNQASALKSANMLAPAAATRWPDPMSTANPAANPPATPTDQNAESRTATPPAKPQVMPRAVPPVPLSEKPISLPMLITIIAGGFSVFAVLVSVFFAWRASRMARRTQGAAMSGEPADTPRRPGDLYRQRKQLRVQNGRRRAA